MERHHISLAVKTRVVSEFIDITPLLEQEIAKVRVATGFCIVYIPHTTAGITINENADPDVRADILAALHHIVPALPYRHGEGNSPAHIKASLLGFSVTVPIDNGKLALGTWQGVYLAEFDGPRTRRVEVYLG